MDDDVRDCARGFVLELSPASLSLGIKRYSMTILKRPLLASR